MDGIDDDEAVNGEKNDVCDDKKIVSDGECTCIKDDNIIDDDDDVTNDDDNVSDGR